MNIKRLVYNLLKDRIRLRDNRSETVILCLVAKGLSWDTAVVIARHYKEAATIDRMWRRCQQQNPELRGQQWSKRQAKQEDVKKELGYNL